MNPEKNFVIKLYERGIEVSCISMRKGRHFFARHASGLCDTGTPLSLTKALSGGKGSIRQLVLAQSRGCR